MGIKVLTPSGVQADGEWEHVIDIPVRVPDRWEHYFFPEETQLICKEHPHYKCIKPPVSCEYCLELFNYYEPAKV